MVDVYNRRLPHSVSESFKPMVKGIAERSVASLCISFAIVLSGLLSSNDVTSFADIFTISAISAD